MLLAASAGEFPESFGVPASFVTAESFRLPASFAPVSPESWPVVASFASALPESFVPESFASLASDLLAASEQTW